MTQNYIYINTKSYGTYRTYKILQGSYTGISLHGLVSDAQRYSSHIQGFVNYIEAQGAHMIEEDRTFINFDNDY